MLFKTFPKKFHLTMELAIVILQFYVMFYFSNFYCRISAWSTQHWCPSSSSMPVLPPNINQQWASQPPAKVEGAAKPPVCAQKNIFEVWKKLGQIDVQLGGVRKGGMIHHCFNRLFII